MLFLNFVKPQTQTVILRIDRPAGANVETPAVHRAFDFTVIEKAARQIAQLMRAKRIEGTQPVGLAGEEHGLTVDVNSGESIGPDRL